VPFNEQESGKWVYLVFEPVKGKKRGKKSKAPPLKHNLPPWGCTRARLQKGLIKACHKGGGAVEVTQGGGGGRRR